jgi:hypothetical protein
MSEATVGEWIWALGNGLGIVFCVWWWVNVWRRGRRARQRGENGALRILYVLKNALCFVLTFAEVAFTLLGVQALYIHEPTDHPGHEQQVALAWVFVFVPVFIIAYVVAELLYRRKLDALIDRADALRLLRVPNKQERADAKAVLRDTDEGHSSEAAKDGG